MRHVGQILDVWRGSSSRKAATSRRGERRCSGRVANWLAAEATTLPADATKGNWSNACSAASSSLLHSAFWVAVMPALHLILQQPLPLCLIDRRPTPATTLRQPCGTRFNCCILLLRCLLLLQLLPGLCQAAASGTKPIELKLCARACKKRDGVDRLMPPTTAAAAWPRQTDQPLPCCAFSQVHIHVYVRVHVHFHIHIQVGGRGPRFIIQMLVCVCAEFIKVARADCTTSQHHHHQHQRQEQHQLETRPMRRHPLGAACGMCAIWFQFVSL